jgi:hypothetical protein
MKISDNEIIKALECCLESECEKCQYQYDTACKEYILHGCLSFINRQKAEINKLNKKIEEFSEVLLDSIKIKAKEIKAEAIKEFAEAIILDYPEMEFYLMKLAEDLAIKER